MKPLLFLILTATLATPLRAADPVVSNVRASQRAGDKLFDILYDVADADSNTLTVSVTVSTNGGATYDVPATHFSGPGYGSGIAPGTNHLIVWDARSDWNGRYSTNLRFSVTADDGTTTAPPGMVLIPAGPFTMGDSLDGDSESLPLHTVQISAFYMDKYDVTKALWDDVRTWANTNGYDLGTIGLGKATNHPVQTVNWYDCVKWCNARSEKEGKTPAYYTSAAQITPYRTGQTNVQNDWVKWTSGYRLPTEAEWEKAARGGASGQRFPWGNTITHSNANYLSHSSYAYDLSPTRGYHPSFQAGGTPYTSPVDYFPPNGYGLYDMSGNVYQWCWDRYGNYSSAAQTDPRGPASGRPGVMRGGGSNGAGSFCKSAYRINWSASERYNFFGFRVVLAPGQP